MMFAKGPQKGNKPKQDALYLLPSGTRCYHVKRMNIRGYVVALPNGQEIASAGNAQKAWEKAQVWAEKNLGHGQLVDHKNPKYDPQR